MVRIHRAGEIGEVAGNTRGRQRRELVIGVAQRAIDGGVFAGQREFRGAVVKGRAIPT